MRVSWAERKLFKNKHLRQRMKPEWRGYGIVHERFWRTLAHHIGRVGYRPDDEFTLDELADRLAALSEQPGRYRPQSIQRYLVKYFARSLESPLLRAERDGYWRINAVMYKARPPPVQLKVGRPRKHKLDLTDGPVDSSETQPSDYRGHDAAQPDDESRTD